MRLEDLTPYHRDKVIERARTWRLMNTDKVIAALKGSTLDTPAPPMGSHIFDPAKWTGANWLWFTASGLTRRQ